MNNFMFQKLMSVKKKEEEKKKDEVSREDEIELLNVDYDEREKKNEDRYGVSKKQE